MLVLGNISFDRGNAQAGVVPLATAGESWIAVAIDGGGSNAHTFEMRYFLVNNDQIISSPF